jgi:glycosyltransferase involved in cell wall biosynthesis
MVVNCMERTVIDGVEYVPLSEVKELNGDIVIINTSGGDLDLTPVLKLSVVAKIKILWAHGFICPRGLEELDLDFVYSVSNHLRDVIHKDWGVSLERIFVAYNPYDESIFSFIEKEKLNRDPYRLVYFSHPSKGLNPALAILGRLRSIDERYHLVVMGGPKLWGQPDELMLDAEGVIYRGLTGQVEVVRELRQCAFSLCLQAREEPFGLVVVESMRAGCVVLASPVGAYPEIIQDGIDGYLITGNHDSSKARNDAGNLILQLSNDQRAFNTISNNASTIIWNSTTMARTWVEHWYRVLGLTSKDDQSLATEHRICDACGGEEFMLSDGFHCCSCGMYRKWSDGQVVLERNGY